MEKIRGKEAGEGLKVCVGLGEKREEVGEAVAVGGLGFSSWSVWLAVEKGECRGSKRGR